MFIKLLLVLSGEEKVYRTAPGGSKKIRSPNLTSNTNLENQKKKKNAGMDNFWRKKDKQFNKNVLVRDLQLFTTFQ